MSELNARLLAAHDSEDKPALVKLYQEAASQADDTTAEAFFLTQAYIFALDCGDPVAGSLRTKLVEMGCDEIRT